MPDFPQPKISNDDIEKIKKPRKRRMKKKLEEPYYPLIKQFLERKFKEMCGNCYLEITAHRFSEKIKEAIPPDANIIFSFLGHSKGHGRPDITGFIKRKLEIPIRPCLIDLDNDEKRTKSEHVDYDKIPKKIVEWAEFIIVEVKYDKIELGDIYQAKRYADLFSANYSFLLSYKPIPEKIKRLSLLTNILRTSHFPTVGPPDRIEQAFFEMGLPDLILGQYLGDSIKDSKSCIIVEDTWFPHDPFDPYGYHF